VRNIFGFCFAGTEDNPNGSVKKQSKGKKKKKDTPLEL
jgi:hypothetical protein